jgi:hypothetical protein
VLKVGHYPGIELLSQPMIDAEIVMGWTVVRDSP